MDHSNDDLILSTEGDRNRKNRDTGYIIFSAIKGIYDPLIFSQGVTFTALFRQKSVFRKCLTDHINDLFLGLFIYISQKIIQLFFPNIFLRDLAKRFHQDIST